MTARIVTGYSVGTGASIGSMRYTSRVVVGNFDTDVVEGEPGDSEEKALDNLKTAIAAWSADMIANVDSLKENIATSINWPDYRPGD